MILGSSLVHRPPSPGPYYHVGENKGEGGYHVTDSHKFHQHDLAPTHSEHANINRCNCTAPRAGSWQRPLCYNVLVLSIAPDNEQLWWVWFGLCPRSIKSFLLCHSHDKFYQTFLSLNFSCGRDQRGRPELTSCLGCGFVA